MRQAEFRLDPAGGLLRTSPNKSFDHGSTVTLGTLREAPIAAEDYAPNSWVPEIAGNDKEPAHKTSSLERDAAFTSIDRPSRAYFSQRGRGARVGTDDGSEWVA